MGFRKISVAVLLFEMSVILAQTTLQTEVLESKLVTTNDTVVAHTTEPENEAADIYEVQDSGKEPIAFVLPQQKTPTLREIVYYHFIERPNGKIMKNKPKPLEIDFDDTFRPFTNSHGFQFTGNHQDSDAVATGPQELSIAPAIGFEPGHQQSEQTQPPNISERKAKSQKMRQARKTLLDKLAEIRRNIKKNNDTASAKPRPKREFNEMPEAPKLEDIDLPQLGYMFATVEPLPDNVEDPTANPHAFSDDHHKSSIKDKVESIFVTLRPFSESQLKPNKPKHVGYLVQKERETPGVRSTGYDEDGNEVVYDVDHGNARDGRPDNIMAERPKNMADPITYGMNLSLDHGYVWNKLVEPAVLYDIQPQDYEIHPTLPTLDVESVTPTIEIDVDDQQEHLTESPDDEDFDIYVDIKKNPKHNSAKNAKITKARTDDDNDAEEDEDNKYNDNGEEEKDNSSNSDGKLNKRFRNNNKHGDKKSKTRPSKSKYVDDEESLQETDGKKRRKPTHNRKPQRGEKPDHNEKPDVFHQLLDSDKFWQWLARWTSSYMEHLTKAVKDMVKKEIKRQLQNVKHEIEINKTKDEEPIPESPGKHDKKNQDHKTHEPTQTDGGNMENDEQKKLNKSSKNDTTLEEPKTNNTKSDIKDKPTEKSQDLHKLVTGNEKTTNIFILLPDASTKEVIQSIIGKPSDEIKNDKQKNDAIDKKIPKFEEQKPKDKSPNESKNHKDENTKDKQQKDEKPTDKTPTSINTKDEKPNNKKPVEEKPEKEKSKDESSKRESIKNDKPSDEKPEVKKPEESKKPEPELEKKEPPPTKQ